MTTPDSAAEADPSLDLAGSLLVQALAPETGLQQGYRLPLSAKGRRCVVSLTLPPGASALRVPIYKHVQRVLNVEIVKLEASHGREVQVAIELAPDGTLRVEPVGGQGVWHLSRNAADPAAKVLDWLEGDPLDLVILVDGTCEARREAMTPAAGANPPRIGADAKAAIDGERSGEDGRWTRHVRWLVEVCLHLRARHQDLRVAMLAFGDSTPTGLDKASGLWTRYTLHPADGPVFEDRWTEESLASLLLAVPATSGGDYIDALADALVTCVGHGSFRHKARKLILLSGDSPGYSILNPPRTPLANAQRRRHDVESAARALHENGVEIATVFQRPQIHDKAGADQRLAGLLRWTEAQYRSLASRAALAVVDEGSGGGPRSSRPEALADALARPSPPILARGSSLGIWRQVTPSP